MEEGSGTASSLSWEVLRILSECENKPQLLIMENVPEVHGTKNIEGFQEICNRLQELGYTNWYEDMNARDYGVAQNRERCFMVSILGEYNYKFPVSMELTKTMNDYLDDEVDDRYYINTQKAHDLIVDLQKRGQLDGVVKNVSGGAINELGFIDKGTGKHQSNTIYGKDGVSPCLPAVNYKEPIKTV